MICSKCGAVIKRYNALIYRNKLYCRGCRPEKQEVTENKPFEEKKIPEEKPKKRVRKRLTKNKE
jgi:hypothetical protein